MRLQTFQLVSTVALLCVGLWLFAHTLPRHDDTRTRLVAVGVFAAIIIATMSTAGFAINPTLSDDMSFLRAIASFFMLLSLMFVSTLIIWSCSPLTALYCCSSAYLLQNLSDSLDRMLHMSGLVRLDATSLTSGLPVTEVVLTLACATVVFATFSRLITRKLQAVGLTRISNPYLLFAIVPAILMATVFDLAIKDIATYDTPTRYQIVLCAAHLMMSAFILMAEYEIIYNQSLQNSLSVMQRGIAEQERQFALSRDTIDAINRRCHDIRHRVANTIRDVNADGVITREEMAQVLRDIDVYESVLRTGNAALDVVLTEKGLLARKRGITLSCVADGHALDFLAAADIYALFSAALDGAIEVVCEITCPEQRSISLNVRERLGMACISIEHYLPKLERRTDESHQAGALRLATIREVVERHDGTISDVDDRTSEILHLDMLIPQE